MEPERVKQQVPTSSAICGEPSVKAGVKLDNWSGGKVDKSPGGGGFV